MQSVYDNSPELEQIAKDQYCIPDFLMMEHAAKFMADFVYNLDSVQAKINAGNLPDIIILCGKGNNGGDGFALARLLQGKLFVTVLCPDDPTSQEAIAQYKMCKRLGIKIINEVEDYSTKPDVVVDCLFGTGFYGELPPKYEAILSKLNEMTGVKVACDIPSALAFKADYTITMGVQKFQLYTDAAKEFCGKIIVTDLGISKIRFEEPVAQDLLDEDTIALMPFPSAYLIEKSDMKLPVRSNPATHKGNYGHTAIFAGAKSGAGIMAATAAMNFGSGLTSIISTPMSNLDQFKLSPELMLTDKIPEKTTCVVIGPGLGVEDDPVPEDPLAQFISWFTSTPNPTCVLDADIFDFIELKSLLEELNNVEGGKIILTPHVKEYEKLVDKVPNVSSLQNVTVVRKSANTFITSGGEMFIVADGGPSLAKGGSGDVLAGMIAALLSQGYSAKDAAITACEAHAIASTEFGADAFDLTPEKLLGQIAKL